VGDLSEEEERYRKLAAEARADAATVSDPYSKRTLLLIAQRYETLAERAATRGKAEERKADCA